ncbi:AMP-dependent synthetase/ligase [Actinospica sp.]|uniref:AMP-dependent synthetase/ligase n=1 Tax=Actinospica sp. TaxID=1872142 RepID=UPI002D0CD02D|nr:AMP-dependent synthetase/ligase [Actinospica sp.]HWG22793.1 AMP-dependent synthetase/ligase [Actinospica sp.]
MREFTVEPLYKVPEKANLTDLVHTAAAEVPNQAGLARKVGGAWRDVTFATFLAEVQSAAKGLVALGVSAGDRVAIMSRTSYEWSLLDFAIWEAGGVPVPIYETSSAEQVAWILKDSGAVAVFTELDANTATVESVRDQADTLKDVWQIEASGDGRGAVAMLGEAGAEVSDEALAERRATLLPETVATIIYTSGTTGRPKGCMLTHGNLLFEAGNAVGVLTRMFKGDEASTLLFLPLAHVFARIINVGALMARAKLGYCGDTRELLPELASFQPTFLLTIPRVLEKVYNSASAKAHSEGKGKIFDAAAATAIAWGEAKYRGKIPVGLNLKHKVFDRLVYGKLRAALGGQTAHTISGGAPLGERLTYFYNGIGLTVCEGYGLTETSPAIAVNPIEAIRPGTVGLPLPGVTLRIAGDGEIEAKGEVVFQGYWRNDEATRDVMTEDGFFKTGDLGELDQDGYLRITGRKKELLVTSGGKNVAPAVLEDRLNAHALVAQSMVVGDAKPFISALITLDPESLPHWLSQHGKPADMSLADLCKDPELIADLQAAIDDANKAVSKAESVRKFEVLPIEWTITAGQLTPKQSIRRHILTAEYAEKIEAMYAK